MVLKKYISLLLFFVLMSGTNAFSQCFQIKSIGVDACGATEGFDEYVKFETTLFALNSNTISVTWPGNAWQGVIQNATTAATTAVFNANIAAAGGCGQLIEPIGGIVPFNSTAILFTSHLVNPANVNFGALNQNIYVVYQNNASVTAGHFANSGTGTRTLTMTSGVCTEIVTYDRSLLVGNDGAAVNFLDSGTPAYVNNGCSIPAPFFVDAGLPQTVCPGSSLSLSGTAEGETSFQWSAPSGTFSNPGVISPTYTVDPAATGNVTVTLTITDACGNTDFDTVTISLTPVTTPNFSPIAPFCAASNVPALSPVSPNGITGTWNPTDIDNTTSADYIFTPDAGQCAAAFTLSVTVIPNTIPDFANPITICAGNTPPTLNNISPNGITGTWNPPVIDNTISGAYFFSPTPGQCATWLQLSVTVTTSTSIVPDFPANLTVCSGNPAPTLYLTSPNGISGNWNPPTIDTATGGNYVFTPNPGQCALPMTMTVTVSSNAIPDFATSLSICNGSAPPTINTISPNGITGTWNPATISNTASGTYTFTPTSGQCAVPVSLSVTVTNTITPDFATSLSICSGSTSPSLNTISPNGITGTWNPSTISNTASGTYTFTPNSGQCAVPVALAVTVTNTITPDFATSLPICSGSTPPTLNTISPNGITGTWNPASISNTASGTYTFTPSSGQCAVPVSLSVMVTNTITPDFATSLSICSGSTPPSLNTISPNGITGTWNPSTISNTASGTYTFTPNSGQCAVPVSLLVTVTNTITPDFATSLSICNGSAPPTLNTISANGITGTWNPATISNTASGTYTFTPNSGQCATSVSLTVTVGSSVVPDFATSLAICTGASVPPLNTTSPNGVSGVWNPTTINNTASGIYTFTPNSGQCATSVSMNVTVGGSVVPDFVTSLTICTGASVPSLNTTSPNGISGVWNPAAIDNTASGIYTFTPNAGQCASPVSLNVTVGSSVVPDFATSLAICTGGSVPALNTTSPNGISGSWNPTTIDNTASGIYTFTPNAGQCATSVLLNVTVGSSVVPDFATSLAICTGGSVPALNTTSPNGISGSWNPTTIDNTASGIYTFTPNSGQCAVPVSLSVTVTNTITPDFATSLSICNGSAPPTLNTISANGITGTWNPATISNTASGTYTFTPNSGQCAVPVSLSVTVTNTTTPDFATSLAICTGATVPSLNTTSPNGISGVWNPTTIDNTASGVYTFTPNAGQCATSVLLNVTVGSSVVPDFATSLAICTGATVPALITTSPNGISGVWNPTTIDNTASGIYTFTPNAGQCASPVSLNVTVGSSVVPDFATNLAICTGATVPSLITTSPNGISGVWNPATIDNTASGIYIFTPNAGQCATSVSLTVTVGSSVVPDFATSLAICTGATVPALNTTSPNGISGVWNPATIDNTTSGIYTFTPNSGQCASPVSLNVTVGSSVVPDFSTTLAICTGASVPPLNTTSPNGISGVWNPTTIDNTASGIYIFTPNAGQCASSISLTVTVGSSVVPDFATSLAVCTGASVPSLITTSPNGISGVWNPATIDNTASAIYTFTPNSGQCATSMSLNVTVGSSVTPDFPTSLAICTGASVPSLNTTSPNGISGSWNPATIDNTASGIYTFTPNAGQCASPISMNVTVGSSVVPDFGTSLAICTGASVPALSTTSPNGISGVWNPTTIDNTASGIYIFTPNAGQCASSVSLNVTVGSSVVPDFATSLAICTGASVPSLNTTSPNGISGVWNPATIDNTASGIYTFTPNAGQCATSVSLNVTVGSSVVPDFATTLAICTGGSVPSLNTTSPNGISGVWNPTTIDNTASGIYTFTPNSGQCATSVSMNVTVNNTTAPVTSFTYQTPVCHNAGMLLPQLGPGFTHGGQFTSDSGLAIDISSGLIDVAASSVGNHTVLYGVSGGASCALPGQSSFSITIAPAPVPLLSGNQAYCVGSTATITADIPGGNWLSGDPSAVQIDTAGNITAVAPGQSVISYSIGGNCPVQSTMTISVYPRETPSLTGGFICIDNATGNAFSTLLLQTGIPYSGHTFIWTLDGNVLASAGNNHLAVEPGLYEVTVTNTLTGCQSSASAVVSATSAAIATATVSQDFANQQTISVNVTGGLGNYLYQLNDGPFQSDNVFTGLSGGDYTITVKDVNGCEDLTLHVQLLDYPRFFTPNDDGFNDFWQIDGLSNQQAHIHIFDRYGKLIKQLKTTDIGWDGNYNGQLMPSSDYWFILEYVDRFDVLREFRSHFSLKR